MSGSTSLTAAETTDLIRFCGYPVGAALQFVDAQISGTVAQIVEILAGLTASQIAVLRTVYLPVLTQLEADIPAVRTKLSTAKADVWERNANELAERTDLFDDTRRRLCYFLGVPTGVGVMQLSPAAFVV